MPAAAAFALQVGRAWPECDVANPPTDQAGPNRVRRGGPAGRRGPMNGNGSARLGIVVIATAAAAVGPAAASSDSLTFEHPGGMDALNAVGM